MSLNEVVELIHGAANTSGPSTVLWLPCRPADGSVTVVIFPIHNGIAVAEVDLEDKSGMKVVCTLKGHSKFVNGLSSMDIPGVGTEVYSCGEDGSVRIWRRSEADSVSTWRGIGVLPNFHESKDKSEESEGMQGLRGAAITVSSVLTHQGAIIASSDSAGNVAVWHRKVKDNDTKGEDIGGYGLAQILKFPPAQTPHSLHMFNFDSSGTDNNDSGIGGSANVLMLIGSVDSRTYVATSSISTTNQGIVTAAPEPHLGQFAVVGALSGHEEWVTSLCSKTLVKRTKEGGAMVLVASGSKDFKVNEL